MASYRLAANVIGRSSGRSATGAAAYRAGVRIVDERTGMVHDYTRRVVDRDGRPRDEAAAEVLHTEIMAPENAPEWMRDRAQLWNGVEAAEKRKDAQLARELQLSLPHELTQEQRVDLVRRYVQEQHVSRGMVADIAIHAPSAAGDERNHHAHIMLTLRELLGDGFGKKARDWNSPEVLQQWREAWAETQNREFERLGLKCRVDHRSLEDQGAEREPTKHLGPIASDIERDGRASHRGTENREIERRNALRADLTHSANLIDAKIAFERRKFEAWAERKRGQLEFNREQRLAQFQVGLAGRMAKFERQIDAEFGQEKQGLSRTHEQIAGRLDVRGWRRFIRDITLTTRKDRRELEATERQLEQLRQSEELRRQQARDLEEQRRRNVEDRLERDAAALEKGINTAKDRREAVGWTNDPEKDKAPPPPVREEFNKAARGPEKPVERDKGDSGDQRAAEAHKATTDANRGKEHENTGDRAPEPPTPAVDPAAYVAQQQAIARSFETAAREQTPPTPSGPVDPAAYVIQQQAAARSNDNAPTRDAGEDSKTPSRD